jgi:ABC-2 type transport system ATP-binding protein
MTSDAVVEATGLTRSFGATRVLSGLDLRVARGTIHALLGPNGAGKTTTVRILATLLRPDSGTARVAGYDVARQARQVRRLIGLTGQYAAVDELLTGAENLVLMGRLHHLGRSGARRRAAELLERFDLGHAAHRPVRTYSGGMRRRLDLAATLITRPPVIFLDEPTVGLDPRSRQTLWDVVRELAASGVTILLTTQYLEEADRLAGRIALIDGGTVIAEGTAEELKRTLARERVELFFGTAEELARAAACLAAGDRDEARRSLSLATDGSAAEVHRILDHLARHGVAADRLAVHRPTLDDVFLALTGRKGEAA